MAQEQFRVSNAAGMWLRTQPIVSDATRKMLLPNGHVVTKLGDSDTPDWWLIRTTIQGVSLEGFSKRTLMAPITGHSSPAVGSATALVSKTLGVLAHIAPQARPIYLDAFRQGAPLFERHEIATPRRMAHFLAQAMQETGRFTVLRENMSYSVPRMLEIFGVGKHSARITAAEAPGLARNERALAERVYGLGNPGKARELGNREVGDGFRYRGNGILQTTGRGNHRRMGEACGVDFEGQPELVTAPEHALKPALQEWSEGNLNQLADRDDIRTITLRINGGLNGFEERKAFFARLLPLLA